MKEILKEYFCIAVVGISIIAILFTLCLPFYLASFNIWNILLLIPAAVLCTLILSLGFYINEHIKEL